MCVCWGGGVYGVRVYVCNLQVTDFALRVFVYSHLSSQGGQRPYILFEGSLMLILVDSSCAYFAIVG